MQECISAYEIVSETPLGTPLLCVHCGYPSPTETSIPKTRYKRVYVLRVKPFDSKHPAWIKKNIQQKVRPFGDYSNLYYY